ncbi:MAG: hypothetical protein ACYDBY_07110 [Thermoanaerobaculia bacterium]
MSGLSTSHDAPRGRLTRRRLLAAAAVAVLSATPAFATIWTRANVQIRIPKGSHAVIQDASYFGRDWSIALTGLEVREEGRPEPGLVSVVWTFRYTNTDKEPHFAAVTVRCLDSKRSERARFNGNLVLQADARTEETFEVRVKLSEAAWQASTVGRIVVDFLSGPNG